MARLTASDWERSLREQYSRRSGIRGMSIEKEVFSRGVLPLPFAMTSPHNVRFQLTPDDSSITLLRLDAGKKGHRTISMRATSPLSVARAFGLETLIRALCRKGVGVLYPGHGRLGLLKYCYRSCIVLACAWWHLIK